MSPDAIPLEANVHRAPWSHLVCSGAHMTLGSARWYRAELEGVGLCSAPELGYVHTHPDPRV